MLTKPQFFYDHTTKQALGFQNLFFLRKAKQLEPKLYGGNVIKKTNAIVIRDFEETLMLAEESRSKMLLKQKNPKMSEKKVNTTPVDYAVLNQLSQDFETQFVPHTELSTEQAFWSLNSPEPTPSSKPTKVEVPKELLKVSMSHEKDTIIKKLKERIKSLSGNMNEDNIKNELEEIETINIKLDHRVTKLIAENEHLKQTYKQLYDSIKSSPLKVNLRKLKGKAIVDDVVPSHPIDPKLLKVDVAPLAPKLRNNSIVHSDYLRHTQEETATLREIVEQERSLNPLNTSLDYVCSASGSQPLGNTKKDKIQQTPSSTKKNKIEAHPRTVKSSLINKNCAVKPKDTAYVQHSKLNVNSDLQCVTCNGCLFSDNHDSCALDFINNVNARVKSKSVKKTVKIKVWKPTGKVVQIVLWYLDSGCSKHITGDRSQLTNFINKFLGTVKFDNDHVEKIMGYGDYHIGNVSISRVYFVEGLGHNLFSVGQSRGNNLYTLSLGDMIASSPICLLSKASKTNSWLWHRCLSHLNFGVINHLARQGLVRGLPKLKFEKEHMCYACAMGKSKKKSHKPKSKDTNQEKLYLLHMDLCGPIRVKSVNGKKYILIIVDDYSRFIWVKCLRLKDKAPDFIIKFLKMIQVRLKMTVQRIRTDNRTEFVNQTLREYYEQVGISHETSVARSPQQNGVVERRNQTLIEAARTMLIYAKALLFLRVEAVTTACYTQNRSIVRLRHRKTPYELLHNKLPNLSFFHVFGALCYPTNDSENLGKLQPKADIGPALHEMTTATISSGLLPNPPSSTPFVPPSRTNWDILLQPLFDELLTPPPSVDHPAPEVITPIPEVVAPEPVASTGSPSSTTVNQDAPSPSNSQSTLETQPPIIPIDVEEDNHDIKILQSPRGIFINQSKYALESLKKYGFESCDPVDTLMMEKFKLDEDKEGKAIDLSHYRGMIGTLLYLTASRPDLQFAICMCARYQARPTKKHLHEVKRIFRYLRGIVNQVLWYPKDSLISLTAFVDADNAGCQDTRRSTSGSLQFLGDKLISWSSKRQKSTAISNMELNTSPYPAVVLKFSRGDHKLPIMALDVVPKIWIYYLEQQDYCYSE
nr:hypothetical protein [Tanacetum cinerariifolium]